MALSHFDEALGIFQKSVDKDAPETGAALEGRARSLLALGRTKEARAPAERALALAETRPEGQSALASAELTYAQALATDPARRAAARARATSAKTRLDALAPAWGRLRGEADRLLATLPP